jgi:hypothetical protein
MFSLFAERAYVGPEEFVGGANQEIAVELFDVG